MKKIILLTSFLVMLSIMACRDQDCYDAEMEANHPGICTQDCPGVCGCDGETYCNECIANSQGIAIVSNSPCD